MGISNAYALEIRITWAHHCGIENRTWLTKHWELSWSVMIVHAQYISVSS